ncbi:MAG: ribonuclease P protein component [Bacteroidales bacterium]|nr:ribonuclease P protein component [Bacteroidales bacterium]
MTLPARNTLSKEERLYCKRDIERLLADGRWGSVGFLRFRYIPQNGQEYARLMVSVPKKNFKRAVKRNLLKRRIRESFRLRKALAANIDILFTYTSKEIASQEQINTWMDEILYKVSGNGQKQD